MSTSSPPTRTDDQGRGRPFQQADGSARAPAPGRCLLPVARRGSGSARSPSFCPGPAPTDRSACGSSRRKAASRSPRTRDGAAFQGMPRSAIGTGIVDLVLPPEKMPEALLSARPPSLRPGPSGRSRRGGSPEEQNSPRSLALLRAQTSGLQRLQEAHAAAPHPPPHGPATGSTGWQYIRPAAQRPGGDQGAGRRSDDQRHRLLPRPEAWEALAEKVIAPLVAGAPARRDPGWVPAARPARRPTRSPS